jgi:hypothetical protein
VVVARFKTEGGFINKDEQHIIQNTIAKNKYPEPEKLLEFDLLLTSLREFS